MIYESSLKTRKVISFSNEKQYYNYRTTPVVVCRAIQADTVNIPRTAASPRLVWTTPPVQASPIHSFVNVHLVIMVAGVRRRSMNVWRNRSLVIMVARVMISWRDLNARVRRDMEDRIVKQVALHGHGGDHNTSLQLKNTQNANLPV